jgi:hypothetical protein
MEVDWILWAVAAGSGFAGILACALCEGVYRARARQDHSLPARAKLPVQQELFVRNQAVRPTAALGMAWMLVALWQFGLSLYMGAAFVSFIVAAVARSEMHDGENEAQ